MSGVAIVGELMGRSAELVARVPLTSQFGGGLPQDVALPAVMARRVSRVQRQLLNGPSDRAVERIQITARAETYEDQVEVLALAVKALDGFKGTSLDLPGVAVTYAGGGPDFQDETSCLWMGSEDVFVSFPTA